MCCSSRILAIFVGAHARQGRDAAAPEAARRQAAAREGAQQAARGSHSRAGLWPYSSPPAEWRTGGSRWQRRRGVRRELSQPYDVPIPPATRRIFSVPLSRARRTPANAAIAPSARPGSVVALSARRAPGVQAVLLRSPVRGLERHLAGCDSWRGQARCAGCWLIAGVHAVLIPVTVRRATAYQLTHLASRRISNKGQAQTPTKRALCGPCGPCRVCSHVCTVSQCTTTLES
jgi:hypothetical protein